MLDAKKPLAPVIPIVESAKSFNGVEVREATSLISLCTVGEHRRYFISYLLIDFAC